MTNKIYKSKIELVPVTRCVEGEPCIRYEKIQFFGKDIPVFNIADINKAVNRACKKPIVSIDNGIRITTEERIITRFDIPWTQWEYLMRNNLINKEVEFRLLDEHTAIVIVDKQGTWNEVATRLMMLAEEEKEEVLIMKMIMRLEKMYHPPVPLNQ